MLVTGLISVGVGKGINTWLTRRDIPDTNTNQFYVELSLWIVSFLVIVGGALMVGTGLGKVMA